jgi:hypothetical protein
MVPAACGGVRPSRRCVNLTGCIFPHRPADKADANLPNCLQRARINYFAHLQPRMRNRWQAV